VRLSELRALVSFVCKLLRASGAPETFGHSRASKLATRLDLRCLR